MIQLLSPNLSQQHPIHSILVHLPQILPLTFLIILTSPKVTNMSPNSTPFNSNQPSPTNNISSPSSSPSNNSPDTKKKLINKIISPQSNDSLVPLSPIERKVSNFSEPEQNELITNIKQTKYPPNNHEL